MHGFQQFAGVVHAGSRCRVDFQHVVEPPLVDVHAGAAFAAGRGTHPGLAVQALGQDARQGGLADAAGAGEQEGVVHPVVVQPVDQGLHHGLLADQLIKGLGAPLAGQDLVTHADSGSAEGIEHIGETQL